MLHNLVIVLEEASILFGMLVPILEVLTRGVIKLQICHTHNLVGIDTLLLNLSRVWKEVQLPIVFGDFRKKTVTEVLNRFFILRNEVSGHF